MISNLQDKVAVITGGAGGIGMALARAALDAGMCVAIADISQEPLDAALLELDGGERLIAIRCDVSSPQSNESLAAQVEAHYGAIHLLCLNAGIGRLRPLQEVTGDEWRLQVDVNLNGPFYGARAFLPYLEKQAEAHIVITASVMSLFSAQMMGPYYATKAGVLSLAEGLYFDLRAAGSSVGVSALMPGDTSTNAVVNSITEDTDPEVAAAAAEELANATPPSVVANAVLQAVQRDQFYILPNPGDYWSIIDARMTRMRSGDNPQIDYDTV